MKIPVVSVNPWWVNLFTTSLSWWLNPTHLKKYGQVNLEDFHQFSGCKYVCCLFWALHEWLSACTHDMNEWVRNLTPWLSFRDIYIHIDVYIYINAESQWWEPTTLLASVQHVSVSPKECFWQIEGEKSIARGRCFADAMQEHNFPLQTFWKFLWENARRGAGTPDIGLHPISLKGLLSIVGWVKPWLVTLSIFFPPSHGKPS